VYYGQRTIDEMCLLIVGGVFDLSPELDSRAAAKRLARSLTPIRR
jgi:hypothetical protein